MPSDNRRTFRLSDEEYTKLQQQAARLGLNSSEYIRLIIALDAATEILGRLREGK
jgi:predicted DNA binding CopG/RHH family protein